MVAGEPVSVFANLDLFAVSLLVASDLGEGLGLGGALLLNLDAAEFFGDSLHTFLAFWAIAVVGRAIGAKGPEGNAQNLSDHNEERNNLCVV